jgi:hypothetical protein
MVGGPSAEADGEALFARIKEAASTIPNLDFVGFVPFGEIDAHFNAARLFVNTSDYEGFPNTFLQSWSRGIPTVSFCDTGSALNGRRVVSLAADMDEMTGLVERLTHDDTYWDEISRRVRGCYQAFHTLDAAVDVYARVFEKHWEVREERRRAGRSGFLVPTPGQTILQEKMRTDVRRTA